MTQTSYRTQFGEPPKAAEDFLNLQKTKAYILLYLHHMEILLTFITCGIAGIVGFIEGIIYLTKSDEVFYNTYQVGKRPWF